MQVVSKCGLLARARCRPGEKAGRAVAAQVRDQDAVPVGGQRRRDLVLGTHVIRETVQQKDGGAIGGAVFFVGEVEDVRPHNLMLHRWTIAGCRQR